MAVLPVAMIAATAVISAAGTLAAGQAQANAAAYNAKLARMQAAASGAQVEQDWRRKIAETKAAYAASGVDVGTGSPLEVVADEATQGALAKRLVLWKGATESQQEKYAGEQAKASSYIGAGTSLLTGAGKTYTAGQGAGLW